MIPLLNVLVKFETGNQASGVQRVEGETPWDEGRPSRIAGLGRGTNKLLRPSESSKYCEMNKSFSEAGVLRIYEKGGGNPIHDETGCKPQYKPR